MTGTGVYELVTLATSDQEYLDVSKEFQKTSPKRPIVKVWVQ